MLKLIAIGNLGKDAEIRDVNGAKVIDFSIAHTEKFTSNGVQQDKTVWIRCSYWNEKTGIAQYLKKGTQVYVEGAPSTNAYTNKDGQNVSDLRLRVFSIQLLGGGNRNSGDNNTTPDAPSSSSFTPPNYNDVKDDLPF